MAETATSGVQARFDAFELGTYGLNAVQAWSVHCQKSSDSSAYRWSTTMVALNALTYVANTTQLYRLLPEEKRKSFERKVGNIVGNDRDAAEAAMLLGVIALCILPAIGLVVGAKLNNKFIPRAKLPQYAGFVTGFTTTYYQHFMQAFQFANLVTTLATAILADRTTTKVGTGLCALAHLNSMHTIWNWKTLKLSGEFKATDCHGNLTNAAKDISGVGPVKYNVSLEARVDQAGHNMFTALDGNGNAISAHNLIDDAAKSFSKYDFSRTDYIARAEKSVTYMRNVGSARYPVYVQQTDHWVEYAMHLPKSWQRRYANAKSYNETIVKVLDRGTKTGMKWWRATLHKAK